MALRKWQSPYMRALRLLYTDTCEIYRVCDIHKKDGTTYVDYPEDPLASITCKYSVTGLDSSGNMTEARNPRVEEPKLFCDPGLDIRKGDRLHIMSTAADGSVIDFIGYAGKPGQYKTHKEIRVYDEGEA